MKAVKEDSLMKRQNGREDIKKKVNSLLKGQKGKEDIKKKQIPFEKTKRKWSQIRSYLVTYIYIQKTLVSKEDIEKIYSVFLLSHIVKILFYNKVDYTTFV